ncbi:unnamed protein product [Staurois parvus]|uniref:Uncharacterized protein n=1 Tax=Staurois parvus TaxID=386267 RepID=A0ABN9C0Y3_9NEOB|nr:unnamed protein product [Staurois parvus]
MVCLCKFILVCNFCPVSPTYDPLLHFLYWIRYTTLLEKQLRNDANCATKSIHQKVSHTLKRDLQYLRIIQLHL